MERKSHKSADKSFYSNISKTRNIELDQIGLSVCGLKERLLPELFSCGQDMIGPISVL